RLPHFDFVAFWSAGRAVAYGLSPYDAQAMAMLQAPAGYDESFFSPFYYPLWTALAFVPFGVLPLHVAGALWQTLNQIALLGSLVAVLLALDWQPGTMPFVALMGSWLAFHPALVAFINSQFSIVILALVSWTLFLLVKEKAGMAGCLLALTIVKPQLGIVIVPALLGTMVLRRQWTGPLSFGATLVLMVGGAQIMEPGWIGGWLDSRAEQVVVGRIVPSLWGLAYDLGAEAWLWVGGAASGFLLLGFVWAWWRCRSVKCLPVVVALAVIVGQAISPFLWTYDQVLLLLPYTVALAVAGQRRWHVAWRAVLGLWAVALPWLLYEATNMRQRSTLNALLPLVLLAVLVTLEWRAIVQGTHN
ncbi:MAG: glycosyltransferase family 87 protein, partial [Chloroflexota bacterium]|nr:glycosyltransferase family 87 protein [Chloroflexota bacterium]